MQNLSIFLLCLVGGILLRWLLRSAIRRAASASRRNEAEIIASGVGTMAVWAAVFLGLDLSIPLTLLPPWMQSLVHPTLSSISVLVGAFLIHRMFSALFVKHAERHGTVGAPSSLFQKTLQISLYIVTLLIVLDAYGVKVTTMIATLGIGGLALALALQETLSNLFAGMYITIANQIKVGDLIVFEGHEGVIHEIGWRNTLLRKSDESFLISPNSKLSQSIVVAYPASLSHIRSRLVFQIPVDEPWQKALELCNTYMKERCARPQPGDVFLADPPPVLRVSEAKDGLVELQLVYSVRSHAAQAQLRQDFFVELYELFKSNGIALHNPHRKTSPVREA